MRHTDTRARQDALIVGALTAVFALVSLRFDLSEGLMRWTHAREWLQLDELPQILLVFAALLVWFALRRVLELRVELARRRAAELQLANALAENRHLGRQAVELQEAERRTLAREMHDELGQYLVAIRMDATAIRSGPFSLPEKAPEAAGRIVEHAEHVQTVLRDIIGRLRPAGLDELGLAAALEGCVDGWRRRQPAIEVELFIRGDLDNLGEETSLTLYRLTQECLTNASRHAAASWMQIAIDEDRDTDGTRRIAFSASDNGRGTLMPAGGRGFGLAGMRERVQSLGGSFQVESSPGAGFRVQASIPRVGNAAKNKERDICH